MYVVRGGSDLVDKHFLGEDYNIVVVLSSFCVICSSRKSIRSYIGGSRDMFNDEIVF